MRLFVSYAHVDWQFVENLTRRLGRYHEVWFDERLHAGADWWEAILEQLDRCEGFVYVLSPESLDSKYCRDEFEEALQLGKTLIPVRMQENINLPGNLSNIHYADFATRVFEDALADLIGDLSVLERRQPVPKKAAPVPKKAKLAPAKGLDEVVTFKEAVEARQAGDHETALRLFNRLQAEAPDFLPEQVADLVADSGRELEALARHKEYLRRYQQVGLLALDDVTLEAARSQWAELQAEFPDSDDDPEGLAARLAPSLAAQVLQLLPPPFEWVDIPGVNQFQLETDEGHKGTYNIAPFRMAKYPVTYAQFQVFIDAADGFRNDAWWQGLAERQGEPGEQKWPVDDHPRENVSWYDAVAFCRWLSDKLGYEARLPTEWEWQWAAQGPEGLVYPYGNTFDKDRCNTSESGIKQTTPVDRYPAGASPFGLLDMSGNVWEWCLNEYETPGNTEPGGALPRVVRGGSWYNLGESARAAVRAWGHPLLGRSSDIGFRVAVGAAVPVHAPK